MEAIIALLAQALNVDAEALAAAITLVTEDDNAPTTEGKVPFTKANGEVVMATPKQAAAWSRFRDNAPAANVPAAKVPAAKVTQSTRATDAAKVVIGFRASGALARRSAYVVAEALGLENTPATRKALLSTERDALLASLDAAGVAYDVVAAASLS